MQPYSIHSGRDAFVPSPSSPLTEPPQGNSTHKSGNLSDPIPFSPTEVNKAASSHLGDQTVMNLSSNSCRLPSSPAPQDVESEQSDDGDTEPYLSDDAVCTSSRSGDPGTPPLPDDPGALRYSKVRRVNAALPEEWERIRKQLQEEKASTK